MSFIVAAMRREGIDARLLPEHSEVIKKSLRRNTGQCLPLSIIAESFMTRVKKLGLDPAKTALWTITASIACNLRMFPHHLAALLAAGGMKQASVYTGVFSFQDISLRLPIRAYTAYLLGGMLMKAACRIRPYETSPGATDRAMEKGAAVLRRAFGGETGLSDAIKQAVDLLSKVPARLPKPGRGRPKAAILGDLYVRDNDVMNQDLVRFIEQNGGEAVITPYSDYLRMIAGPYFRKWLVEREFLTVISSKAYLAMATRVDNRYRPMFEKILPAPNPQFNDHPKDILKEFGVRIEHNGESMENLLKVHYLKKHYPDLALFVQASPAFCCPSLVTEAMGEKIEQAFGVPVVSITYDGAGGLKNDAVVPYLRFPRNTAQQRAKTG